MLSSTFTASLSIPSIYVSSYLASFSSFISLSLCEPSNCSWQVPIQTKLIDFKLLDESQRAWLTAYHERVRESIAPFVEGEDLEWLMKNTETSS